MARVVHARRKLVGEQLVTDLEQLDGEDPDVPEVVEEPAGDRLARGLERGGNGRGGRTRRAQDPAGAALGGVPVLHERIAPRLACEAAHRENRELAVESDHLLQDRGRAELRPCGLDGARAVQHHLPFAVVAATACLEDRRCADVIERTSQLVTRVDRSERGDGDAEPAEGLLLDEAVLRDLERIRTGADGVPQLLERSGALGGHAFPLVRDGGGASGDVAQRSLVAKRPDDERTECLRRRFGRRIQKPERQPERHPRQPEHPPELPAPEHRHHLTHARVLTREMWCVGQIWAAILAVAPGPASSPLRPPAVPSPGPADRRFSWM